MDFMTQILNGFFPYRYLFSTDFLSLRDVNNFMTAWTVSLIQGYFIYSLLKFSFKMKSVMRNLKLIANGSMVSNNIEESFLKDFWHKYQDTLINTIDSKKKTSSPAEDYFDDSAILNTQIHMRYWNAVPGILVGLGILGTFIGLTTGISGFDIETTEGIKKSISTLLAGMNTAFATSVWGMLLSLLFSWREKKLIEGFSNQVAAIRKKIDTEFKMTKEQEFQLLFAMILRPLLSIQSNGKSKSITEILNDALTGINATQAVLSAMKAQFNYTDADGREVIAGNVIRDLLYNSEEQTKTLKAFSTDLADGIKLSTDTIGNLGNVLGDRLEDKLSPIVEDIRTTLQSLASAIAEQLQKSFAPYFEGLNEAIESLRKVKEQSSTSMIEGIVGDLKSALNDIVDKFNNTLSSTTTQQLSDLALQLGSVSSVFQNLPGQVQSMLDKLESSSLTQQQVMQELTENLSKSTMDTIGALKKAIEKFQSEQLSAGAQYVTTLQQQASEQSQLVQRAASDSVEQFAVIVTQLQDKLNEVIKNQNDLINKFETQAGNSIEILSKGGDLLAKTNQVLTGFSPTITKLGQVAGEIGNVSSRLGEASSLLNQSTGTLKGQMDGWISNNQKTVQQLTEALRQAQSVSSDFATKFKVIQDGLTGIFAGIQDGLTKYKETTSKHLNDLLGELANSLSSAVGHLSATIQEMSEIVEDTNEVLSRIRR